MAVSPARAAALEILLRIEREESYASELLHSARLAKLSAADHGLTTELVRGVTRWRSSLDQHIAGASRQELSRLDLEVLTALRLGVYQLGFLSRIPAWAAIFESVEMVKAARKRSAATFVNAVLRKLAGAAAKRQTRADLSTDIFVAIASSPDSSTLARTSAHPEWLVARWRGRYGLEATRRICIYDQHQPPTSVRIYDDQALEELASESIALEPGRLLSRARTVLAGDVSRTHAYREGRLAIQDEGSQLVALLAGQGKKILDCCSAPGGKTRVLAMRNPGATVVAAELHPHRARLLRELIRPPNVRVVTGDARQLPFSISFDRILADVPCSGTGTLARNPEIKWRLRQEDLNELQGRQIAILKSALGQLAGGGRLVYSTCSLEQEENEAVVEAVLSESSSFSLVDCAEQLEHLREVEELDVSDVRTLSDGRYLRTVPGVQQCDGFFAAIIVRK